MTYFDAVKILRKAIARDEQANEALDTLIHLHEVAQRQTSSTVHQLENAKRRAEVAEVKLREYRYRASERKKKSRQQPQKKKGQ